MRARSHLSQTAVLALALSCAAPFMARCEEARLGSLTVESLVSTNAATKAELGGYMPVTTATTEHNIKAWRVYSPLSALDFCQTGSVYHVIALGGSGSDAGETPFTNLFVRIGAIYPATDSPEYDAGVAYLSGLAVDKAIYSLSGYSFYLPATSGTLATLDDIGSATGAVMTAATEALSGETTARQSGDNSAVSYATAVSNNLFAALAPVSSSVSKMLASNLWIIVSNRVATILETDGGSNVILWTSGESADPGTNALWIALTSLAASIPSTAWGNYLPDGSVNPDAGNTLSLNSAVTLFLGGCQWAASGGYAVMSQSGTVAYAAGTNGQWRIGPDVLSNYFGYVSGDTVMVAATNAGITVNSSTVVLRYPYSGGDFPVIYYVDALEHIATTGWQQIADPLWVDEGNGYAYVTIAKSATSGGGFFMGKTTAVLSSYFINTMPEHLTGGVVGGDATDPVVYDSTITVTSGGKTYRLPAQEVK